MAFVYKATSANVKVVIWENELISSPYFARLYPWMRVMGRSKKLFDHPLVLNKWWEVHIPLHTTDQEIDLNLAVDGARADNLLLSFTTISGKCPFPGITFKVNREAVKTYEVDDEDKEIVTTYEVDDEEKERVQDLKKAMKVEAKTNEIEKDDDKGMNGGLFSGTIALINSTICMTSITLVGIVMLVHSVAAGFAYLTFRYYLICQDKNAKHIRVAPRPK